MSHLHYAQANINHGYTRFLPWHRLFLLGMEEAMTRCLGKPVAIPYWNAAIDASLTGGVRTSPLFKHLGGEGRCVLNLTVAIPNKHCLQRSFDDSLNLATREQVARLIETDDFEKMAEGLEGYVVLVLLLNAHTLRKFHSWNTPRLRWRRYATHVLFK